MTAAGKPRTHGHCANDSESRVYIIWLSMRSRCQNPRRDKWARYGGRGITVCERWQRFENFWADMGEPPAGHSLERIDNDGPYSPENCRWASQKEQCRNTSRRHHIVYQGLRLTVAEWAERQGIPRKTLSYRLNTCGWDVERALTTPVMTPEKTARNAARARWLGSAR